jgi:hypothetical protein
MSNNLSTQLLLKGIQPVEKFTGTDDQDPVTWLQDVDELFEATKTEKNDRRRLLPMYFGDDAKKWFRSIQPHSQYDEFKQQFITAFTSSAHKLKIASKLINRQQNNNESVQSYYYDMLTLCKRFNEDMKEDEKMAYIQRGLKPSIKQHIIINDPENCQELFEQAKRIETAATIIQHETATTTTIHDVEETTAALRRTTINPNNRQNAYSNRNDERYSYHDRRRPERQYNNNYVQNRQQRHSSHFMCYNCNGVGHYSYQCPSHLN